MPPPLRENAGSRSGVVRALPSGAKGSPRNTEREALDVDDLNSQASTHVRKYVSLDSPVRRGFSLRKRPASA
jgi:hypothetical protein